MNTNGKSLLRDFMYIYVYFLGYVQIFFVYFFLREIL